MTQIQIVHNKDIYYIYKNKYSIYFNHIVYKQKSSVVIIYCQCRKIQTSAKIYLFMILYFLLPKFKKNNNEMHLFQFSHKLLNRGQYFYFSNTRILSTVIDKYYRPHESNFSPNSN